MAFPEKPIAHLLGSTGPVHAVTYSASPGTYILAGSADRSIRLYNPQPSAPIHPHSAYITKQQQQPPRPSVPESRLIQTYSGHGYEVLSLAVSADNARFASSGGDRSVFLWDVASASTLRRFGGNAQSHSARVNAVAFAGDGDGLLVSASLDATVRLWDCRSAGAHKPVQVLGDARDAVTALAVRGPEVVAGCVDGRVRTYDVRAGRCVTDVLGPSVTSLALTQDGKALLVATLDSKVRLMDRESGACLRTYGDPARRNEDLRAQAILGGAERYVLAGDETPASPEQHGVGRLWAWDVVTGQVRAKIHVPWGPPGSEPRKKAVGRDGKPKERTNIISCIAWRENGFGDQFCVGGTSGAVTVYGHQ